MYFANTIHIPVGMVLEYKKPLNYVHIEQPKI